VEEISSGSMKPYNDGAKTNNTWVRQFEPNTDSHELVWHRDKNDRVVKVLDGDGWVFQMDEEIPLEIKKGDTLYIQKEKYHRLFKAGVTALRIEISE
jgi:mannose-6-phosphate isomerase-like protein (cupin superfamily)